MSRQPNAARDILLANWVTACRGMIAAAGTTPGIMAISNMPPPMPMTAARQEVTKTIGTRSSSLTSPSGSKLRKDAIYLTTERVYTSAHRFRV